MAALSELEMRILAFERSWWRVAGAKEREILEVLGMPVTRYYQLLNELIDRPEAAKPQKQDAVPAPGLTPARGPGPRQDRRCARVSAGPGWSWMRDGAVSAGSEFAQLREIDDYS